MSASQEGHVECVKMLLDSGAEVNMQRKVSSINSTYPKSPVVDNDMCTRTLLRPCLTCYLSVTSKKRTWENAHKLYK